VKAILRFPVRIVLCLLHLVDIHPNRAGSVQPCWGGSATRRLHAGKIVTGTIVHLVPGGRTGIIRTAEGGRVLFAAGAVLGDYETLAVGQRVSFDLDRGHGGNTAARVMREPVPAAPLRNPGSPADLRYRGFDQRQNVRAYRFDAVGRDGTLGEFVVTVDVDLLLKHHVSVQEIPALCLRKLASDLKDSPDPRPHQLASADLLAHTELRTAALQRKRAKAPFHPGRRGASPPPPWGGAGKHE
jgi:cold shock CspA family protein